jgi:hypothetical protein
MIMMTISSTTNHQSTISTLLMKVMTPFLIVPTMKITSMTTCHQISFAKMKKRIPHLKRKVDLTKKPIPHLKGKVDLTKKLIPDEYGEGVEDMMNMERELMTSGRR